jgi:hypothetical protein
VILRGLLAAGVALLAVLAVAGMVELASGRPQVAFAGWAAGVILLAALASAAAEWQVGRAGGEALVLAYWVGVGVRGIVALAGAGLVAAVAVNTAGRQAYWLWVLAAYIVALAVETVRQVRAADREVTGRGSVETGPIETEGTQ